MGQFAKTDSLLVVAAGQCPTTLETGMSRAYLLPNVSTSHPTSIHQTVRTSPWQTGLSHNFYSHCTKCTWTRQHKWPLNTVFSVCVFIFNYLLFFLNQMINPVWSCVEYYLDFLSSPGHFSSSLKMFMKALLLFLGFFVFPLFNTLRSF